MTDHRQNYSPFDLLVNGGRMTTGYTVDDAVADYMAMHPEVTEAEVRAQLQHEIVRYRLVDNSGGGFRLIERGDGPRVQIGSRRNPQE